MVALDNSHRAQTDLRRKPRRALHYRAQKSCSARRAQPRPCSIEDVSESGARIVLQKDEELPKRFLLLVTSRGVARVCREVWRHDLTVGLKFVDSDR